MRESSSGCPASDWIEQASVSHPTYRSACFLTASATSPLFVIGGSYTFRVEVKRCGRCGTTKPVQDFMWRRHRKNLRDSYCRVCRAAYKQEHYKKNRARYIGNATERNERIREERMAFLYNYLKAHPCLDCGETDV